MVLSHITIQTNLEDHAYKHEWKFLKQLNSKPNEEHTVARKLGQKKICIFCLAKIYEISMTIKNSTSLTIGRTLFCLHCKRWYGNIFNMKLKHFKNYYKFITKSKLIKL
jgi:hypothetical protein